MPMYDFVCSACGAQEECYLHVRDDLGAATPLCACGSSMGPIISVGRGLTWFEEGRARVLWNLGPEPVTVRSHGEHQRLMRERGLDWATKGRGRPGQWI